MPKRIRGVCLAALAASLSASFAMVAKVTNAADAPLQRAVILRYPVALALADDGRVLLTANERSGSVSSVDLPTRRVETEVPIGKSLSAIAPLGDDGLFLVTDFAAHQLYLIAYRDRELKRIASLGVSPFPAAVVSDKNGERCFVASLWSRKLTIVDVVRESHQGPRLKVASVLSLPFAPRLELLSPDGCILVVADAFGGELGMIRLPQAMTVRSIPGHNIRGLAWSGDGKRLLVSHQTLNRLAYTSAEDVHWGSVVSNVLRSLDRDALESPGRDVLSGSDLLQLGDVGNGAGDPASLAVTKAGSIFIALAGVGDVAATGSDLADIHRVHVGIRPTVLASNCDGSELYVADTFGDSIIPIKTAAFRIPAAQKDLVRISLGPQPALSAAERGEQLFFDAHLSHDNWMSCHSCHTDGQSSDGLADTLGDGSFGAPKRIPALGGVAETAPWAWNGSIAALSAQVHKSVLTTMRARHITDEQAHDITEYLKTLKPAPPIGLVSARDKQSAIERGHAVFSLRGCSGCHVPPTFTSPRTYDVGLRDELGNHQFNPPSLRGVSQRTAFFHDGRAKSLDAVFTVYQHPGKTQLTANELADLLAYLRSV